jgi:hypothetical protein
MDYTNLEDAYGTPFGQRVPITHQRKDVKEQAKPEFTSLETRAIQSVQKNQSLLDTITKTLPLDTDKATESFRMREQFASSQPAGVFESIEQSDKLSRILRLIEQNKTGYERPALQDMVLYIATGIFFLFTFDTFVLLGKSMRR